jgi:hypothetical protein
LAFGGKIMNRVIAYALVAAACLPGLAMAAQPPARLRGVIETVTPASVTLQTDDGTTETLELSSATQYSMVSKASLNEILPESYIGTAAKGSGANMIALEVVIFSPAMRGAGEGHYAWDPLPDVSAAKGTVASSMTNGSVSSVMPTPSGKVSSSMTNGSVQTVTALPGAKQISVVYKGGKQIILVLPATPVVSVQPADHSVLTAGAHVFAVVVTDSGKPAAAYLAVGAPGVTPPM